jgi:hypothetical protein
MPNQLAKSKRRQSLAEHEVVLEALSQIARQEDTTVMALLREAARNLVRQRAANPALGNTLSALAWRMAPRTPSHFRTPAQVARFKRLQREFDRVMQDLQLTKAEIIQDSNSLISSGQKIIMIDFDVAHSRGKTTPRGSYKRP